jgi:hypothetical protein
MKSFLLSFSFEHPERKGEHVQSIALVYAETFEGAMEKVNKLRTDNGMEAIPSENFANATIE